MIFTFLLFGSVTSALHLIDTNCTLSNTLTTTSAHYVSSPSIRGTLDIVWSCLATFVACTYTVLHPNVSRQYTTEPRGAVERRRRRSQEWEEWVGRIFGWVLLTIFMPELILARSIVEFCAARAQCKELRKSAKTWSKELKANCGCNSSSPNAWHFAHGASNQHDEQRWGRHRLDKRSHMY